MNEISAVVSFFFHEYSSSLERILAFMLSSLLTQLCRQVREARIIILNAFRKKKESQINTARICWNFQELQDLLDHATLDITQETFIFIDALNEIDENETPNVFGYLRQLNEHVQKSNRPIHICVSCRRYLVLCPHSVLKIRV